MQETLSIAVNTITELGVQDGIFYTPCFSNSLDKLVESQATLANIHDNLDKTDTSLTSIGSWWGFISTKYLTPTPSEGVHTEAFHKYDQKLKAESSALLGTLTSIILTHVGASVTY
jgi:hypothetical protein